jgi:DNA-binding transcriptional ArsR family regulator
VPALTVGWFMIEMVLAHVDLARVRFAHSPARELVASLLVLQDPTRQPMHGRWLSTARRQLDRGEELKLLTALVPAGPYLPGFLLPAPTGPWGTLAEELDAVAASPPALVRAELDTVRDGRPLPAVLRPLYEDPAAYLPTVVGALRRYWRAVMEPCWPRLRALSTADLTYRMEQFANGGLARVLADLHSELTLEGDRLRIDKPHHCQQRFDLAGTGILLVPCAFIWPSLMVECCGVDQPAVTYPTRGVAELWEEPPAEHTDPLIALVGRTRATLLATLGLPRTTTQLAGQLGLSPPAVSQHLKVLKDTALVSARRRGRMVLYQRTPAASMLLKAIQTSEEAG